MLRLYYAPRPLATLALFAVQSLLPHPIYFFVILCASLVNIVFSI
jgi:hypothetical protein